MTTVGNAILKLYRDGSRVPQLTEVGSRANELLLLRGHKKERVCSNCAEPFEPCGRERICPECRLERDIYREELRESRLQK